MTITKLKHVTFFNDFLGDFLVFYLKLNLEKNKGIRINIKNDFIITMIKSPDSQKLFDTLKKAIKFMPQVVH